MQGDSITYLGFPYFNFLGRVQVKKLPCKWTAPKILECLGGYTDNGPADSQDEAWKKLDWAAGLGA